MRGTLAVIAAGAGFLLAAAVSSAQALPLQSAPITGEGIVTQVAQGCGPGFARGAYGRCQPMYRAERPRHRPYVAPYRAYGGPRCVVRHTPVGPRRICR